MSSDGTVDSVINDKLAWSVFDRLRGFFRIPFQTYRIIPPNLNSRKAVLVDDRRDRERNEFNSIHLTAKMIDCGRGKRRECLTKTEDNFYTTGQVHGRSFPNEFT